MKELKQKEMLEIDGGASEAIMVTAMATVSAIITFFVGVLSGYVNPKSCNE